MTYEELRQQIAEILEMDLTELTEQTSRDSVATWDSMAALSIISLLDDACDDEITSDDIGRFISFRAIVEFARNRGILKG